MNTPPDFPGPEEITPEIEKYLANPGYPDEDELRMRQLDREAKVFQGEEGEGG